MKYKISKSSEMGKKIDEFFKESHKKRMVIKNYLDINFPGTTKYYGIPNHYVGLSGIVFPEGFPDYLNKKHWVKDYGWRPNLRYKAGKEIQAVWNHLPKVHKQSLTSLLNYDDLWSTPGVDAGHPDWVLVESNQEISGDAIEILDSEYHLIKESINK